MTPSSPPWVRRLRAILVAVVVGLVVVGGATDADAVTGAAAPHVASDVPTASVFTPINPVGILDTRTDPVRDNAPIGAGEMRQLVIPNTPAGTNAVVLNVTAVGPTQDSFLTVYPAESGPTPPLISSVDFTHGQDTANAVIVPLGASDTIDIYNHVGTTHVLVAVEGYYVTGTSGTFLATTPTRILDSRIGTGQAQGQPFALGENSTFGLQVTGVAGVPTTGVTAVVFNLAATAPTESSFLTVYPDDGSPRPGSSTLNFSAGQTLANLVVVKVPADGFVDIWNHVGTVDLVVDMVGYYTGGQGKTFVPLTPPAGMMNTTTGAPLTPTNSVAEVQVAGTAAVPATASAVVTHVAVINDTVGGFLTLYAEGAPVPNTSNLNFAVGQVVSNLAIVPVGTDGDIEVADHFGTTNVVANIVGYYE